MSSTYISAIYAANYGKPKIMPMSPPSAASAIWPESNKELMRLSGASTLFVICKRVLHIRRPAYQVFIPDGTYKGGINIKKEHAQGTLFHFLFGRHVVYNLLSFVEPASGAHMMRHNCFMTLRTFHESWSRQFPVSAAPFLACLG